ncbi:unnamed protein product [Amoebophrya sp. A120]|nr:unnamed protein product [Amoebophrya sp. A120]|eukprot:GSA120T00002880001.1
MVAVSPAKAQKGVSKHLFASFRTGSAIPLPNREKLFLLCYWIAIDALVYHVVRTTPEYLEFVEDVYISLQQDLLQPVVHQFALYSLLPLLSSACCAFQLLLNAFSIGCAGFNTVLGPVRPFFLAITILSQVLMWYSIEKWSIQRDQAILATVLAVVLSLLPEALEARLEWKSGRVKRFLGPLAQEKSDDSVKSSAEKLVVGASPALDPNRADRAPLPVGGGRVLVLQTEGMGCVACVTAVQGVLEKSFQLPSVVDLEKGRVTVPLPRRKVDGPTRAPGETSDSRPADIATAVTDAGFPSSVLAVNDVVADDSTQSPSREDNEVLAPSPSFEQGILIPAINGLLSSSCCLVQLLLNLLSAYDILHAGCAGLNTSLGPLRNQIRAVVLGFLSYQWFAYFSSATKGNAFMSPSGSAVATSSCCDPGSAAPLAGDKDADVEVRAQSMRRRRRNAQLRSSALTLFLMFLPELLRYAHQCARWIPAVAPEVRPDPADVQKLSYVIDNMGCEACESGVRQVLLNHSGVLDVESLDFETGRAIVTVNANWVGIDQPAGTPADREGTDDEGGIALEREPDSTAIPSSAARTEPPLSPWETELDSALRKKGYELHHPGWVTKKMKLNLKNEKTKNGQAANPFR